MSMGVEARCRLSKSSAHCRHMKRQPFLYGHPRHGCLLCHCRCHLRLQLRRHCHHHCRRNRPSPWPLPWAIAAAAMNHRHRHLCRVAVSHCCRCCPCRRTLPSPSSSAIAVAIAIDHHRCHAVGHFRELLPWRGKNCIPPIETKNAYLIFFVGTVGSVLIEAGSLTRCQAVMANTSVGRRAASSEQLVRELAGGWGAAGSEGWRR
jgi:hypothetical protein